MKIKQVFFSIIILFLFFSCNKNKKCISSESFYNNIKVYQYHKKDISDFSFLSKYKKLEALDLSSSGVNNVSFIKHLKKLKLIILYDTNIASNEIYKYNDKFREYIYRVFILYSENKRVLDAYPDLFFSNYSKMVNATHDLSSSSFKDIFYSKIEKLNLFIEGYYFDKYEFSNLIGITRFKNLKTLKIALRDDLFIDELKNLNQLNELHLTGRIFNLPSFQKSLKKLYLYNLSLDVNKFSFLKKSEIEELYIITESYKNEKWNKLKNQYPNIKIEIKNKLFTPMKRRKAYDDLCSIFEEKYRTYIGGEIYYNFNMNGLYLEGSCEIIEDLRENFLDINLTINNLYFFINTLNININHLWNNKKTFLDLALKQNDTELVMYLIKTAYAKKTLSPQRGCEILKTDCNLIPKSFKKLLNERSNYGWELIKTK